MDDKLTFRSFLFSSLFLFIVGWGGLALLLNFSLPSLWPRWGFFVLIVLAATGSSIPFAYWFNRIFPSNPRAEEQAIMRQSVAVGVYCALLAWLEIGRILTFPIAMWLAIGLVVIEYLLRLRATTIKPDDVTSQNSIS